VSVSSRWPSLRQQLLEKVATDGRAPGTIAREIGISRGALGGILKGETAEPYASVTRKIARWVGGAGGDAEGTGDLDALLAAFASEGRNGLETLLRDLMADVQDVRLQRKVVFTVLTALERAALDAGRPISPALLDLKKRLLSAPAADATK
jgi:transcriptional regulator with XRE-family HTH domain